MYDSAVTAHLGYIREWASAKLAKCTEDPWAWRYRDIIAGIDEIQGTHAAGIAVDASRLMDAAANRSPSPTNVIPGSARRRSV